MTLNSRRELRCYDLSMEQQPEQNMNVDSIAELVTSLGVSGAGQRIMAREKLVACGRASVGPLIEALGDASDMTRFEAAKALGKIRDSRAVDALLRALSDPRGGVRWLAAEALGKQEDEALPALLQAIVERCAQRGFCDGAHHALHELVSQRRSPKIGSEGLALVLAALASLDAQVRAPVAAARALTELRGDSRD